jgi:hypothetical protein
MEIKKLRVADINTGAYQRPLSKPHIRNIITQFDERLLGLPVVSIRKDGSAFVVDGQHRIAALAALGIKEVECQILRASDSRTEANLFVKVNTTKTRLNGVDKFFALIEAQDQSALACQSLFAQYGWTLTRHFSSRVETSGALAMRPNSTTLAVFNAYPAQLEAALGVLATAFPADADGIRSGEVAKALINMTLIGGLSSAITTWMVLGRWTDDLRAALVDTLRSAQLNDFADPQIPKELTSHSNAKRLHGASAVAISQRVAAKSRKYGWKIDPENLSTVANLDIKRSFAVA